MCAERVVSRKSIAGRLSDGSLGSNIRDEVPALVAELADALGSGPSGLNAHGGSSPSEGTSNRH